MLFRYFCRKTLILLCITFNICLANGSDEENRKKRQWSKSTINYTDAFQTPTSITTGTSADFTSNHRLSSKRFISKPKNERDLEAFTSKKIKNQPQVNSINRERSNLEHSKGSSANEMASSRDDTEAEFNHIKRDTGLNNYPNVTADSSTGSHSNIEASLSNTKTAQLADNGDQISSNAWPQPIETGSGLSGGNDSEILEWTDSTPVSLVSGETSPSAVKNEELSTYQLHSFETTKPLNISADHTSPIFRTKHPDETEASSVGQSSISGWNWSFPASSYQNYRRSEIIFFRCYTNARNRKRIITSKKYYN
ncbi:unnamed protein product [Acanthosepion pharaonis]|uniref:Uncharacterized protein n=1 Tax=Acanthosepion pharaonis TaxID=158019 RepID=A0A812C538_ACAPH|nr:unnamed protein product [Sepia pharaonis]